MWMLIVISWRNVWRSPKRSIILLGAVVLGLWTGIFLGSFYNGMIEQRVNTAIGTELSHIQIHHPKFRSDYDIQYGIPEGENMMRQLQSNPLTKGVSGRFVVKGMVASANGSAGISINGIMPDGEPNITRLKNKIVEGTWFTGTKPNEVLVSTRLMKKLKLKLKRKAILTFQDSEGNLASMAVRITGVFETVNGPWDEGNVFVTQKELTEIAGMPGTFNEMAILLHSNDITNQAQLEFEKWFPEMEVKTWQQLSPELGLTVSVGSQMVYIFMGIILLALSFGIVNTMMMAVLERTKEIGMLLALGMNRFKVFSMILLETLFLILAGCPVGIGLAVLTIWYFGKVGINFSEYAEVYSSFGYDAVLYPTIHGIELIYILLLVILTAFLSSLIPARMALKIDPAGSLKK